MTLPLRALMLWLSMTPRTKKRNSSGKSIKTGVEINPRHLLHIENWLFGYNVQVCLHRLASLRRRFAILACLRS